MTTPSRLIVAIALLIGTIGWTLRPVERQTLIVRITNAADVEHGA